jgi:hypothetical protein
MKMSAPPQGGIWGAKAGHAAGINASRNRYHSLRNAIGRTFWEKTRPFRQLIERSFDQCEGARPTLLKLLLVFTLSPYLLEKKPNVAN